MIDLPYLLEGTVRYADFLLAPPEGFGQGFFALWAKNNDFLCPFGKKNDFCFVVAHFWPFVVLSIILSNF